MNFRFLKISVILLGIVFQYNLANSQIPGVPYKVTINGKPVTLYQANTWDPGYVPSYGGPYWFCSFDINGQAEVEVSTVKPLDKLVVLPESKGIVPMISGQKFSFAIDKPMQLVAEPDGKNGALLIFANPPETNVPKQGDPNVIYYGPGEHKAGKIELTDNQTLYLAPGAVVSGGIHAKGKNITIRGRGVLDGIAYERFKGPTRYPVTLEECTDLVVEGIVVKDGWSWCFVPRNCDKVTIDNVKLVTCRVENGDGFDVTNSTNVTISNCFVRSDDDAITPKGMTYDKVGKPVENFKVENCVLWTDRAHIFRFGAECNAEAFRNIHFKNIDIIHFPDIWTFDQVPFCMSFETAEGMDMENMLFEDIRIRTNGQTGFIDLRPKVTMWSRPPIFGSINNVIFRNISFTGPAGTKPGIIRISGPAPGYNVSNVTFENVTFNNELITMSSPNVQILGNSDNIIFKGAKQKPWNIGDGVTNILVQSLPKHRPFVLAEACLARGAIYTENPEKYASSVEALRSGLKNAIQVDMPITKEKFPAKDDGIKRIIIGDCPEAKEEGLETDKIPAGAYEIKTSAKGVFIVGNGDGLQKGVDCFLEYFLGFRENESVLPRTDLIVPPTWICSK